MFSRIGAAALKPSLDNTLRLCKALGDPHKKFPSVHIAGTNGKGSVSHSLAAIFQKAGYTTGLYTSPHLVDFRERIRIGGVPVEKRWVVAFVSRVQSLIEDIQPSFFEITVAMAFQYFAERAADIAVIETGLGGRLDSTNVVTPLLSIITNISYDHADLLGPTLTDIAREKAGIIKAGVPVIVGKWEEETASVFEQKAAEMNSLLSWAEDAFAVLPCEGSAGKAHYLAHHPASTTARRFSTDLLGHYQSGNLATALCATNKLRELGWRMPEETVFAALQNVSEATGLRGRWEVLRERPLVIADVAHNAAGLSAVLQQWDAIPARQKHIILGFVRDKDLDAALALFPPDALYHFCNAQIPRALPVAELAIAAHAKGLTGDAHDSVADAVAATMKALQPEDALLITGSFFVVGEALEGLDSV